MYLVTLAETKHFGKAAEACYVSQPSLSTQIKKLEDELGLTLIERTRKKVLITAAGEEIIRQAQSVLNEVQNLKTLAKQLQDPSTMTLHIGVIPTIAPYLLPQLTSSFKNKLPNMTVKLVEAQTQSLTQMLSKGQLDLLLLALPLNMQGLTERTLFNEPFYAALPLSHRLADKKELTLEDLKKENLLLLEDGHCLRQQALSICDKITSEAQSYSATSLETLLHMVAAGHGATLVPKMATSFNKNVAYKPLKVGHAERTIGLAWRSDSVMDGFINQIVEVFEGIKN